MAGNVRFGGGGGGGGHCSSWICGGSCAGRIGALFSIGASSSEEASDADASSSASGRLGGGSAGSVGADSWLVVFAAAAVGRFGVLF